MIESNYFQLHLVCCFNLFKVPLKQFCGPHVAVEEKAVGNNSVQHCCQASVTCNILPEKEKHLCEKFGLSNVFGTTEKFCSRRRGKFQLTMVGSTCKKLPSLLHALSHFGAANKAGIHTSKPTFSLEKGQKSASKWQFTAADNQPDTLI